MACKRFLKGIFREGRGCFQGGLFVLAGCHTYPLPTTHITHFLNRFSSTVRGAYAWFSGICFMKFYIKKNFTIRTTGGPKRKLCRDERVFFLCNLKMIITSRGWTGWGDGERNQCINYKIQPADQSWSLLLFKSFGSCYCRTIKSLPTPPLPSFEVGFFQGSGMIMIDWQTGRFWSFRSKLSIIQTMCSGF